MSGPLTEMRTMHWTYFLASSVTTVSPVACMRPGNAHWAGCGLAAYGEMVYGEGREGRQMWAESGGGMVCQLRGDIADAPQP